MNALVPELKARGVEAIVVLIHEGGYPTGGIWHECPAHFRAPLSTSSKNSTAQSIS